jgi:N-acetylglucosaminyl-diphospho-decaprenol L-rhamnosyltransferase
MTMIAVCIVSYRDPSLILRCLAALAQSTCTRFEVVICENGGPDALRALRGVAPTRLAGGQPVTLLRQTANLGYAGGVNAAIAARPGASAWLVLNPDTLVEPEALTALVARLARGDCDAVGGVLYHPNGRVQAYGGHWHGWMARATSLGLGAPVSARADPAVIERRINYLLGACMLIGRSFLKAVGPMRDDYFLYAEEIEWCLRGRARGMKLGFAPDALICHGQGATTGSAGAIHNRPRLPIYLDERNKLHVVRDTSPARLPLAIAFTFLLAWARFGRRGAIRQWRYAIAGWWAGVRNQRGMPSWLT